MVELLIVIGIIGVLLGILIPVITRAQAASRSATCLATLRQIGQAFHLYAQDNKMLLPDPGNVGKSWEQLIKPHFDGEFKCSADDEIYPTLGSSYDWRDNPDPNSSLTGINVARVKRQNIVLAFEALSGWHKKQMINVVRFDGSAEAMNEQDCFADLEQSIDPTLPPGVQLRRP
jgi:type II secretory pathway pseudopilin PulG